MHRRDLLKTALMTTGLAAIEPSIFMKAVASGHRSLFFDASDLARIRANAEHPLLREAFQAFVAKPIESERAILERTKVSRDFVNDLRDMTDMLNRQALVHLVGANNDSLAERASDDLLAERANNDSPPVRANNDSPLLILDTLKTFLELEQWDYFMDGREQILGFQRAPASLIAVLFAAEVLGEEAADLGEAIRANVATKGCEPCYWSLWGMRNRETTTDWRFDPDYYANYDVDISNWPIILNETNLKAIPIAGLGLGALALQEHDERYDRWMEMAIHSARSYLELFKADGSYFEGIGYADYSLRNLFIFFEAHMRLEGTIDWPDLVNYYGFAEYAVCLQMGDRPDKSRRDIVNFSDANASFYPSTALWIANHLHDPLAQYAALHFSERRDFTDWLWLHPDRQASPPPDHLLNKRFDLDWIVCRTGWEADDNIVAFRSGKPSNHEHADRNSFIFKAYGERLLTDHYGASYDWRQKGWLLRQTEAHNSVLIDGKGHQYHDGSEGTRPSKASASVVRWVDRGDFVTWSSDATQAYQLVDPNVRKVIRSICYLKPDIVLVVDSVSNDAEAVVSLRFHPDNSDGQAQIGLIDDGFGITRPSANLLARFASSAHLTVTSGVLDVPAADLAHLGDGLVESRGDAAYVFAEVSAESALQTDMLSVLVAGDGETEVSVRIDPAPGGWQVVVGDTIIGVTNSGDLPEFAIAR